MPRRPKVLAYHIILTAYGFWLPNDPRGSWSKEVWAKHLKRFGPATKVTTTQSLAKHPHDRAKRLEAKEALKYPPARFTGVQARAIGRGFAQISAKMNFIIHACSIMPDHAHLVIARHERGLMSEDIAAYLKRAATRQLVKEKLHPLTAHKDSQGRTPTPWTEDGWYVFLDSPDEIRSRIQYVEQNPVKQGLPRQRWSFVTPYAP